MGVSIPPFIIYFPNKRHKPLLFIISFNSTRAGQIPTLSAIWSTSLSTTLCYNSPCLVWAFPTPTGQSSWPCSHNSPNVRHPLLSFVLLSSRPYDFSIRSQAQDLKLHLPLFCSAIGCQHIYSTNNFKLRSKVT